MNALARPVPYSPDNRPAGLLHSDAMSGDIADFAYDSLLDGLQSGRFGGMPQDGPGPWVLIDCLRRLEWQVDERAFAAAVPHMPEVFGMTEVQACLGNLGYATTRLRLSRRALETVRGAAIVEGPGGRLRLVEPGPPVRLVDPVTRKRRRAFALGRHACVLAEPADLSARRNGKGLLTSILIRFRPELHLILALTLVSGLNFVAASLSIGLIFGTVLESRAVDTLAWIVLGVVGIFAFDLGLRRIRSRIVGHLSGRLEYIVSTEIYAKLMGLPIELITGASPGDQLDRLRQFETVRDFFSGPVTTVLLDVPLAALLLIALFAVSWPSALVVCAAIAVFALTAALSMPRIRAAQATLADRHGRYEREQGGVIAARRSIVIGGTGAILSARLAVQRRNVARARLEVDRAVQRFGSALGCLSLATNAAVVGSGALLVMAGSMSGGSLIVCTILAMRLLTPIQLSQMIVMRLPELLDLFRQIDALLKLPSAGGAGKPADLRRIRPQTDPAPLILEGVAFAYAKDAPAVLKGISAGVPPGSLVAVTGRSGAGKSTLLRAIQGLHTLRAGQVRLGRMRLSEMGLKERGALIGQSGDPPFRIYGTVAQNLQFGNPGATGPRMRAVCDELGLTDEIEALPEGFETRLGAGATAADTASWRTRMAIARLLLREPDILLLDEPGAHLSPLEEESLLNALRRRTAVGGICLLVTHRPSVQRSADLVMRLESGRLTFFGPPSGNENGGAK